MSEEIRAKSRDPNQKAWRTAAERQSGMNQADPLMTRAHYKCLMCPECLLSEAFGTGPDK